MTPRRLDHDTILDRLRTMRRLLDQLERLRDQPEPDYGTQLQVERILSALVDLAVAVNTHVAVVRLGQAPHDKTASFAFAVEAGLIDAELGVAISPSVGLRNILVHAYVDLDVERMLAAVPLAAEQYGRYVEQVARWLRAQPV